MATHKTYQSFAKNLLQLLDSDSAVRLTVPSFMPLSIEDIGKSGDGNRLVSLCHYGEQNGDLMRDPDIVFMFHELPDGLAAEPVSFRNDYMGLCQEVYRYDDAGKRTHVVPRLKRELQEFSITWFRNLHQQGFFSPEVRRDILS
ncbi:MAG TPA: hypothetical protein DCQ33_01025 [Nitrospira sp.]|jgi:hypothetical protein|nr:hypothetical protein [Nitrospira sp.]